MNQAVIVPVVLQICAIGVIAAEVILPSGGMLSALSVGLFGFSLYLAFANIGPAAGTMFVLADIVIIPVALVVAFKALGKSTAALTTSLSQKDGVTSQDPRAKMYEGAEGVSYTALRPSGTALINDERVDVITDGEFLDKGVPIRVVMIEGNRIVVSRREENDRNA
jgi:membrane-bound serine protease (ClpP class)